jgi:hypothetical protein
VLAQEIPRDVVEELLVLRPAGHALRHRHLEQRLGAGPYVRREVPDDAAQLPHEEQDADGGHPERPDNLRDQVALERPALAFRALVDREASDQPCRDDEDHGGGAHQDVTAVESPPEATGDLVRSQRTVAEPHCQSLRVGAGLGSSCADASPAAT